MTNVNVRMEDDVKKGLEEFCSAVGMNMSVAINMFAKVVVKEQRLPFEVAADPFDEKTMRRINHSVNQLKAGQTVRKTLAELEAMEND